MYVHAYLLLCILKICNSEQLNKGERFWLGRPQMKATGFYQLATNTAAFAAIVHTSNEM